MTTLLYYSISSNLTEDEIIEIESQVANNRKTVCTFVINLGGYKKIKRRFLGNYTRNNRNNNSNSLNVKRFCCDASR